MNTGELSSSKGGRKVNFEGIADLLKTYKTLNLLVVHGIGPTKEISYAESLLIPQILTSLKPIGQITFKRKYEENPSPQSTVTVYEYEARVGGRVHNLRFFAVHWACITDQLKKDLNANDHLVQYANSRRDNIMFSEVVKRFLINESFSEAFSYGDEAMEAQIKTPVRRAIEMMSLPDPITTMNQIQASELSRYVRQSSNLIPQVKGQLSNDYGFVVISRSFGSKIVFDVVVDDEFKVQDESALRFCGYTHQIYMLANQIPLLNLLDGELEKRIDVFAERHKEYCRKSVRLIAFSDRRDMLSYNLPESIAKDQPIDIVNVRVNNTPNYLRVKGSLLTRLAPNLEEDLSKTLQAKKVEITDPIGAHENYPNNPYVLYLMTNGWNGKSGEVKLKKELKNFPFTKRKGQIDFADLLDAKPSTVCD